MHTPEHLIRECECVEEKVLKERSTAQNDSDLRKKFQVVFFLGQHLKEIDAKVSEMYQSRPWDKEADAVFLKNYEEMVRRRSDDLWEKERQSLTIMWEAEKGTALNLSEGRCVALIARTRLRARCLSQFLQTLRKDHVWNRQENVKIPA